ncbi:thiopurine S-methyltransferase [Candidatus Albibeggiatoa sp. nov. NOAA]|uniref:thiopurine S-methyltransferase n=1 Tax=Candidatus Albibeggiatoa sp. nov. NOAA TaxID=3162724 RepID=UPI0032F55A3D|nr:thiopurine S-methyltransferase [Thiotrichaceae bacterium]
MQADFWFKRWEDNEIGFHEEAVNPLLAKHFQALSLRANSRVFLPLCGKTSSIPWLLSLGHKVVGIELSQEAIEQLFIDMGINPSIDETGDFIHYHADNIDMYVGDFFNLTAEILGKVDAIYDRGSLVALPETMRFQYTTHLKQIAKDAPQLLICYEYDETLREGPPFCIRPDELNQHYEYTMKVLDRVDNTDLGTDEVVVKEIVWLLEKA